MSAAIFNFALILDRLAAVAPACLYGFGVGLLGMKMIPDAGPLTVGRLALAAGVVLAVAVLIAVFRLGGRWYDAEYALAWLDLRNHAGGGIIANRPGARERIKIGPGATLRYLARRLVWPAFFILAAWLVPAPEFIRRASGAGVERALAGIERRLEAAERNQALPPPEVEELRDQLRRLNELAKENPEAASEALSTLPAKVDAALARRLERNADALEKTAAALREVEREAAGAGEPAPAEALSGGEAAERLGEMFESLERLAKNEGGMRNLPAEVREAMEQALREAGAGGREAGAASSSASGGVNPETLERLLEALEQNAGGLADSARASGLAGEAGQGGGGEGGSSGIGALSEALGSPGSSAEGLLSGQALGGITGREYGSGGVDRGPGDAPLFFGDESSAAGARFDYRPLAGDAGFQPGQSLGRERAAIPEAAVPEEFRPVRRDGAEVPGQIHAGRAGSGLGPERARAAETYFRRLGEGQ